MHHRIMTLAALALLSTAGCASVTPGAAPDRLPPRQSLAPTGGKVPVPLESRSPAVQPSARDALVESSTGKPRGERGREVSKDTEDKEVTPHREEPAAVDHTRPAPAPPRPPVHRAPPPRPAAQRPQQRPEPVAPRPARPRPTYDGKVVCRMADGVADPATVALCRDQLGR
ncbi:hypothetical protein ACFQ7F_35420 [Streptomyces sp. NPDC056486]|uniref:hypothetical protein n=1 Tax=Streptomyces sp. NPDC056486 TaxID=3345835 RepID=UPI0036789697